MNLLKKITDKDIFGTDGHTTIKPRETVRVVLQDENDKIAVLFIGNENFYMLPGGGIGEGETPGQALTREALEETGCYCKVVRELGIVEENSAMYAFHEISFCYLAKVNGEKGTPNLTQEEIDENTQLQWHDINEALSLIKNQNVAVYDMKFSIERDVAILAEAMK